MIRCFSPPCLFLVLALGSPCFAVREADVANVDRQNEAVTVTADTMEADELTGTLRFIGNAVARQGDLTLFADRLTVIYSMADREIERVLAEGSVRIVQPMREATGNLAVFDRLEQRITLTGQPTVRQEGSFVQGEQIVLHLENRRSVVTGGDGVRGNARFKPEAKEDR